MGAEYRLDDQGYEYFAVDVEEAAPDADDLAKYVAAQLKENGFIDVHVQTEW